MDMSEVEFRAEEEMVTIIPNFSLSKLYLISGEIGPFVPSLPTTVPLWVALTLRQTQKCTIVAPDWLNLEVLAAKKQEECSTSEFTKMPHQNYCELTQLLTSAQQLPAADEVKTLVKDIWDNRMAKLRSSAVGFVNGAWTSAKVNELTLMEANTIQPLLCATLDDVQKLSKVVTFSHVASSTFISFL
ncbi:GINS2 [Cordylochernes scorpioides]|uniref:DNA replication complex GINS protein PSF2 n=1 Tax=Cordylochernes scorpioides TaxID=51811 RepID=A0ABY6KD04_9ARAC|nr:GINS2 [Cordylochernes scorpioides]